MRPSRASRRDAARNILSGPSTFTVTKYVISHGFQPVTYGVLRFRVGGDTCCAAFTWWRERSFANAPPASLTVLVGAALVGIFLNQLSFGGGELTTGSSLALLFRTFPVMTGIFAYLLGIGSSSPLLGGRGGVAVAGAALVALGAGTSALPPLWATCSASRPRPPGPGTASASRPVAQTLDRAGPRRRLHDRDDPAARGRPAAAGEPGLRSLPATILATARLRSGRPARGREPALVRRDQPRRPVARLGLRPIGSLPRGGLLAADPVRAARTAGWHFA